jgi:hypothetical protein
MLEMLLSAIESVGPMVSHESYWASAITAKKAGLAPPMSAPSGVATWYAGGRFQGVLDAVLATAYTFCSSADSTLPSWIVV